MLALVASVREIIRDAVRCRPLRAAGLVGFAAVCCLADSSPAGAAPVFAQVPGSPFAAPANPCSVALSPSGRFLSTGAGGAVVMFSVAANGSLTNVAGSPFYSGASPCWVAFSPNGRFLAAADLSMSDVWVFSVGADGTLSQVPGTFFSTGSGPRAVAFSPSGGLLATSNVSAGTVSMFSVGASGSLSQVSGSPFTSGSGSFDLAFSPSGGLLAVANRDSNSVSVFSVASDGGLIAVTGSPFTTGSGPVSVAFSPDGELLATANQDDNTVSMFSVAASGTLSPVPGFPLAALSPSSVAFSSDGMFAIADATENAVLVFSVAPSGALTPVPGSPFATDHYPYVVAFSPSGGLLATANTVGNTVSMLSVGPPSAVISSSADGVTFPIGQVVATSFGCTDAAFAPGIVSCSDSNGQRPPSGQLNTATLGAHTYAVAAVSADGQSTASTVSYAVAAPPTASIASPVSGGTYDLGQAVQTSFSCTEGATGPGVSACTDGSDRRAPSGSLNTATAGAHTYTVTATSKDGLTGSESISYIVIVPPPRSSARVLRTSGASVSVMVVCHGVSGQQCIGAISVQTPPARSKGSFLPSSILVAPDRMRPIVLVIVARTPFAIPAGSSRTVRVTLNQAGRRQLARAYKFRAAISVSGGNFAPKTVTFAYPKITSDVTYTMNYFTRFTTVQLLTVDHVPTGGRVTIACRGRGCPFSRKTFRRARSVTLTRYFAGAHLLPGATVDVRITAPNSVGKDALLTTRSGAGPTEVDLCLPPGARKPLKCAS